MESPQQGQDMDVIENSPVAQVVSPTSIKLRLRRSPKSKTPSPKVKPKAKKSPATQKKVVKIQKKIDHLKKKNAFFQISLTDLKTDDKDLRKFLKKMVSQYVAPKAKPQIEISEPKLIKKKVDSVFCFGCSFLKDPVTKKKILEGYEPRKFTKGGNPKPIYKKEMRVMKIQKLFEHPTSKKAVRAVGICENCNSKICSVVRKEDFLK